jgi:hypothetical protein
METLKPLKLKIEDSRCHNIPPLLALHTEYDGLDPTIGSQAVRDVSIRVIRLGWIDHPIAPDFSHNQALSYPATSSSSTLLS